MTDRLTDEELREACSEASMSVRATSFGWAYIEIRGGVLFFNVDEDRAWVESRCVSLLVARVREMGEEIHDVHNMGSDSERIRAAMEVIRGRQH